MVVYALGALSAFLFVVAAVAIVTTGDRRPLLGWTVRPGPRPVVNSVANDGPAAGLLRPGDDIVATSTDGILIRQGVDAISRQRRDSTGVKVMNLAGGAELSAVTLVQTEESDE